MTKVESIRLPAVLAEEVRKAARIRRTSVSALLAWILNIALIDGPDMSRFPDAHGPLDSKIDVRLSDELIRRIQPVCNALRMSVSVYIRTILYGGYTGLLALKQEGGRYKLVSNRDQN